MNLADKIGTVAIILQFVKVPLNLITYNKLHPKKKAVMRMHSRSWNLGNAKKREENYESDYYFLCFMAIFFWLKLPKPVVGKLIALSVLALSLLQVYLIYYILQLKH